MMLDAYVLRSLVRRCSYDPEIVEWADKAIERELMMRGLGKPECPEYLAKDAQLSYYVERYRASGMADIVVLNVLTAEGIGALSTKHLQGLLAVLDTMKQHQPFDVVTIHDSFACHPNHMNHVRKHYRNILAELADSSVMQDILSQIHGVQGTFKKLSNNLSSKIRNSAYALC